MTEIEINTSDSCPVYTQIIRQIYQAIQAGEIEAGHMLPSIRQLAKDLSINPNTVAKAYKSLEENHIIQTAGRKGTFIKENAKNSINGHITVIAQNKISDLIEELSATGLDHKLIKKIFSNIIQNKEM